MKTSNKNKEHITKLHKDKLGMDIPEDFFTKSKEDILSKVSTPEKPKQTIFWLKPIIAYPIAASIVLAIALTFWMKNDQTKTNIQITNSKNIKLMEPELLEGDFLVSSLLVPDSEVDGYLDHYIVNNVIVEAELSEEQLENIFINSLFVDDSLLNKYLNESLIDNLMI